MNKLAARTGPLPVIISARNDTVMKLKKNLKITGEIDCFLQTFLLINVLIFFAACNNNKQQTTHATQTQDSFISPRVSILANLSDSNKPREVLLEKAPKPVTIKIPDHYGGNYLQQSATGIKTIPLLPPATHSFIDTNTRLPIAADLQGRGFFTTYTTDNGLALDQIYCSYKDNMGHLWFGTNGGGVSRYDGKSFANYTTAQGLASNVVWCITQDKTGNLWFGTDGGGASKFDGNSFTNYTTAQGLAGNVVLSIAEDKSGNLWFGTLKGGISKYDGKKFINYTISPKLVNTGIAVIKEDKKGNLWLGTSGGGVVKYNGKLFTMYTTEQGLANNDIKDILEDKAGNLWFATNGGGISKYADDGFTNYTRADGLAGNRVLSIIEDNSGNLWFGTVGGGVSKYDPRHNDSVRQVNTFTNYTTAQGLANNEVTSIIEDEKGNYWFSTYGGGISKFAGNSFTNYTKQNGLSNNVVYSIAEDISGNLWFGTDGSGVSKYDGKKIVNYTISQGLASNIIYSIATDKNGNCWFGTAGGGVSKYNGKSFTNYTTQQGLANNIVFSIVEDKKGNFWFGTSGGGVSKLDGKSFTNYTTAQGLASNVVSSMLEDAKGNLWFGTSGGGVSKFDGSSFTNYTTAQGLCSDVVWAITEDKAGNLWFGTQEGLNLLRTESLQQSSARNSKKLFESFTTQDGLPDNFITQVVQGNDEKLYIGTNLGMCELIPGNAGNGIEKKWTVGKTFNSLTGYPVKDVNAGLGAMFKDSKGIIWIGTGSDKTGLVRFVPKAINNNDHQTPAVVIQSVKLNNEIICWSDLDTIGEKEKRDSNMIAQNITEEVSTFGKQLTEAERDSMRAKYSTISFTGIAKWYPIPEKLVLSHYFNNISFDFNAIEPAANPLIKYQYKLEGYDKDWSTPDHKSSASFGNIFEGTYTFIVRAKGPEGIWSKDTTYTFEVLPPWWRTWWMYTLYAALVIAFVLLFFRWNNRRIISQKKILENKITEATLQIREEKEKVETQKKKAEVALEELEAAQAQLIQAEKMASLGELTAGIAHEIQNPLNFVNNFSDVSKELLDEMKEEMEKGHLEDVKQIMQDVIQNLEKINHHGRRAGDIVKGMLQHSRSSTGVKEPTDINALCDEYLRLSYHGLRAKDKNFNAELKTEFDESISKINIVPQDIGRVLLNLYNNAFYAVNERLKTHSSMLKASYEPTVSISTKKIGDKIEIKVGDNGNGIPQKIVDKIFQPFFTTKPTGQGTGLGLSLSYDIIKAHGGEITVNSKDGEGAEFTIKLPIT